MSSLFERTVLPCEAKEKRKNGVANDCDCVAIAMTMTIKIDGRIYSLL